MEKKAEGEGEEVTYKFDKETKELGEHFDQLLASLDEGIEEADEKIAQAEADLEWEEDEPTAALDSAATSGVVTENDETHLLDTGEKSNKVFLMPNGET